MLVWCWTSGVDNGPIIRKHWISLLFAGYLPENDQWSLASSAITSTLKFTSLYMYDALLHIIYKVCWYIDHFIRVRVHFRNFWLGKAFFVEVCMQLFLHNLGTLIPNLPHAKLYFVFFLLKIQKQNGRQNQWKCHNFTSRLGLQWT